MGPSRIAEPPSIGGKPVLICMDDEGTEEEGGCEGGKPMPEPRCGDIVFVDVGGCWLLAEGVDEAAACLMA